MPAVLTSDQGRQFTSTLLAGLTKLLGIQHVQTTAYHPQSNGMVKRTYGQLKAAFEGQAGLLTMARATILARTAAALTRKGEMAEKVGKRGWSLAIEEDVDSLIGELKEQGMQGKILVLHCMDNGSFFSLS